jgi:hypothetical protein
MTMTISILWNWKKLREQKKALLNNRPGFWEKIEGYAFW